jgi:polysaccharide export outer membrane protein
MGRFARSGLMFSMCAALLLSGSAAPLSAAMQSRSPDAGQQGASPKADEASYLLGPEDQIVVHAVDVPEISEKPQKIGLDGDLRLPMVGRIHAAGMNVEALEIELTKRLKVYLQDPDVSITLTESHSQPVSIIGAVATPGLKQLEGHKTLVEVLSMAGGLSAEAGPTVRVARKLDQGRIQLPEATDDPTGAFSIVDLDAKALLEGRIPEKNIVIQPADLISVPRADVVYVIGEVGKPGSVMLNGGHSISILEAVSSSGGTLRTAAQNHVRILRRVEGQANRTEMNVDLQKIMNGKSNDMALAAGDILVVPDSTGKRATTRAIEAAIQIGTMIGTYGVIR